MPTPIVYVNDVKMLINMIIERRRIANPLVKVGLDGGQGSLKLCVSVIDLANPEGNANSVNDVLLLFIGYGVQENRSNIRKIWILLRMDSLNYILCIDLKVANILCGLKSHSSKYPCCWCITILIGKKMFQKNAELHTVGSINKCYQNGQTTVKTQTKLEDDEDTESENYDFDTLDKETYSVVSRYFQVNFFLLKSNRLPLFLKVWVTKVSDLKKFCR